MERFFWGGRGRLFARQRDAKNRGNGEHVMSFSEIPVFYAFPSVRDQREVSDALVYLPRLEAAFSFGTLFFLFLIDVYRGRDAWGLRARDCAERDEWLR